MKINPEKIILESKDFHFKKKIFLISGNEETLIKVSNFASGRVPHAATLDTGGSRFNCIGIIILYRYCSTYSLKLLRGKISIDKEFRADHVFVLFLGI